MINLRNCFLLIAGLYFSLNATAQGLTKKEVKEQLKENQSFSNYKDIYFIGGVPLNTDIDRASSDVKYQISFKQMLIKNTLFWDTYLYLTYTQKSFWQIFEESSPFEEINFNPSVGLGKAFFDKNNQLKGIGTFALNHNSNGQDGEESRSWNSVNLSYATLLDEKTTIKAEGWFPFMYKEGNPDILDYLGLFKINIDREFIPDKLSSELQLQKGLTWGWEGALRLRVYYNVFNTTNQYLMMEWYMGYGENLLDYTQFRNMVRIGYVIKMNDLKILKGQTQVD